MYQQVLSLKAEAKYVLVGSEPGRGQMYQQVLRVKAEAKYVLVGSEPEGRG